MLRTIERATSAALTLGALGTYELARVGALPFVLAGALALILAAGRKRAKPSGRATRPPPDVATARLRRELLALRLRTAEARLAILAPDVALAARDLAAGHISPEDYATALDVAARAAKAPRRRAFHFSHG